VASERAATGNVFAAGNSTFFTRMSSRLNAHTLKQIWSSGPLPSPNSRSRRCLDAASD
jgi:hypothetical protein